MNKRLTELRQQREQLQERIGIQRLTLTQQLAPLKQASETVHRVQKLIDAALSYLKTHPLQVGLAISALVIYKPRRAWRWLWRGVGVWRSWQTLRAWVPASLISRWF